ncbi:MAG: hypothetical protein H7Z43_03335 [Clostridia bacterium]|nr:hypothetical protein [Deltaproteobacteria bacterium]
MRGFAFVLAILALVASRHVGAESPASQHQESTTFLGFSQNEALAAFVVTVSEADRPFRIIRLISTSTNQVVDTFRSSEPSSALEWQKAKSSRAWESLQSRTPFAFQRIDLSKPVFRLALDPKDQASAKAEKMKIILTGKEGSGLHTTPVVRTWYGKNIWLGETRVAGVPGRTLKLELEAYHSPTGMHVAVLAHYTSIDQHEERATDVARVFQMPGDPIAVNTIGQENVDDISDKIGERLFKKLHPDLAESYDRFAREYQPDSAHVYQP